LGSLINDARCTCENKSRVAVKKAAFHRTKTLFTSKPDFNLRKKLLKCYTWYMVLKLGHWKVLKRGAGEGWRSVGSIV
jgi:hypothetical protein